MSGQTSEPLGEARSVPISYQLRRIRQTVGRGISQPSFCEIAAVLTIDGPESPFATYNELVAVRLAQAAELPIADGVLTFGPTGPAFASLVVGAPGLPLPDISRTAVARAVQRYRREAAQLLVFDEWIWNRDRFSNIKAALISPHANLFAGFDHGHALLGSQSTVEESLSVIRSSGTVSHTHPFRPFLSARDVEQALGNLLMLTQSRIAQVCRVGETLRHVPVEAQEALATALILRRRKLRRLLAGISWGVSQ